MLNYLLINQILSLILGKIFLDFLINSEFYPEFYVITLNYSVKLINLYLSI